MSFSFSGVLKFNSVFVNDESLELLTQRGFGAKRLRPIPPPRALSAAAAAAKAATTAGEAVAVEGSGEVEVEEKVATKEEKGKEEDEEDEDEEEDDEYATRDAFGGSPAGVRFIKGGIRVYSVHAQIEEEEAVAAPTAVSISSSSSSSSSSGSSSSAAPAEAPGPVAVTVAEEKEGEKAKKNDNTPAATADSSKAANNKKKQKASEEEEFEDSGPLLLFDEEAFYLFDHKHLKLTWPSGFSVTRQQLWSQFLTKNANFPLKYKVYSHFREQGFVVKTGIHYGLDYAVYRTLPSLCHSELCAMVIDATNPFDVTRGIEAPPTKCMQGWRHIRSVFV